MSLDARIKKIEQHIGAASDDNVDYAIHVGAEDHKYTKTVNGEVLDITEGEWIGAVTKAIRNKDFNYKIIEPNFKEGA